MGIVEKGLEGLILSELGRGDKREILEGSVWRTKEGSFGLGWAEIWLKSGVGSPINR